MTPSYTYEDHLQTKRLLTRFLTPEDALEWSAFFRDKEAVEFFPAFDAISDEDKAKEWIDKQLERYQEKRFGLQALINRETKEFIGQCGLLQQEVDGAKEIEVGYHIFKKYWGQGYAPEAAKRFIDYAFQNDLARSVISIIDTRNTRSQRVAEKNGLAIDSQTKWRGMDVFIYRLRRENRRQ